MTKGHLPGGLAMTITLLWRQGGGATTIWSSIVEWAGCNKSIYLLPLKCIFSARIPLTSTLDSSDSARSSSNQFKTINTFEQNYDYIKWRGNFLKIEWSLFVKPGVPFTQGCFMPNLVEIGPMVLEKKIFTFLSMYFLLEKKIFTFLSMYFRYFVIISPCKRVGPFI